MPQISKPECECLRASVLVGCDDGCVRAQSLSGYEQYFAMARGVPGIEALDMSKFFDTNYHYLVPELTSTVSPKPDFSIFFDKIKRGQSTIGKEKAVPIIIGALLTGAPTSCLADCHARELCTILFLACLSACLHRHHAHLLCCLAGHRDQQTELALPVSCSSLPHLAALERVQPLSSNLVLMRDARMVQAPTPWSAWPSPRTRQPPSTTTRPSRRCCPPTPSF